MIKTINHKRHVDASTAAQILNISEPTLHYSANYKTLPYVRATDRGGKFYEEAALHQFLAEKAEQEAVLLEAVYAFDFFAKACTQEGFTSIFAGSHDFYSAKALVREHALMETKAVAKLLDKMAPHMHIYKEWVLTQLDEISFVKMTAPQLRKPTPEDQITSDWLIVHYWHKGLTSPELENYFGYSKSFYYKKIKEYGLQKTKNMIKLRGRRGYVMPEEEKQAHKNQPHRVPVSKICPYTFKILKRYNSITETEKDGFVREHVKRRIRTAGVHKGFLWARAGEEEGVIAVAKKRDLSLSLHYSQKPKAPSKEFLRQKYLLEGKKAEAIARELGFSAGYILSLVSKYGLKKVKRVTISAAWLKTEYIEKRRTLKDIAAELGVAPETIGRKAAGWGIRKRA
jgi:plasmid maintenance system antidote protein VapI